VRVVAKVERARMVGAGTRVGVGVAKEVGGRRVAVMETRAMMAARAIALPPRTRPKGQI
jgi:hypothetical protein